jgi:hypothetical protein
MHYSLNERLPVKFSKFAHVGFILSAFFSANFGFEFSNQRNSILLVSISNQYALTILSSFFRVLIFIFFHKLQFFRLNFIYLTKILLIVCKVSFSINTVGGISIIEFSK